MEKKALARDIKRGRFPSRTGGRWTLPPPSPIGIECGCGCGCANAMDINLFKLCSGPKFLGYLMILLVLAIVTVSYYAVVILTWGPRLLRGGLYSFVAFFVLLLFHLLLLLYRGAILW